MTKEQAKLFFPHSSDDNLEDLWEQRFFEQKQFFLTRPPIRIVWMSRLKKLRKQYTSYLILTDQEIPEENFLLDFHQEIVFSDEFIAAFHQFHKQRNEHKSELLRSNSFNELVQAI